MTLRESDEQGVVLRPAILWNDQRTARQCDQIRERVGRERLIRVTGNEALTGFTAPKILWVREHEPDVYRRVKTILLPKDYVRYRLTDIAATDKAGAAGTLLFANASRDWSQEVLDALEIPMEWMPRSYEGTEITGGLSAEAADLTGLPEGLPVVGGGGDQAAQAVGVGAIREGVLAVTLGTSGVVFGSSSRPLVEPEGRLHAFNHAVPGTWHLMGVMLSAAGSFRWYRDTIAPGTAFGDLAEEAGNASLGSEGLVFLPYLTGERTPHPDPLARAAFVGLTVRHGRQEMTRAVLEGVAFGLRDSFELMRSVGLSDASEVRISGGGAASPVWRQIIADVLGVELRTVNTTEGAAFGAALLAGVGTGVWAAVTDAVNAVVRITGKTAPDELSVSRYRDVYEVFRSLYPALKNANQALSAIGSKR
jgi:xylulokinase